MDEHSDIVLMRILDGWWVFLSSGGLGDATLEVGHS